MAKRVTDHRTVDRPNRTKKQKRIYSYELKAEGDPLAINTSKTWQIKGVKALSAIDQAINVHPSLDPPTFPGSGSKKFFEPKRFKNGK